MIYNGILQVEEWNDIANKYPQNGRDDGVPRRRPPLNLKNPTA